MRAARGQFPEFELNRLGNAFYQSPTPLGQGEDDFAALGGQLDEGGGDRLVGNIAGAEPVHAGAPPGLSVAPDTERDRTRPCAQYLDCPATLGGQFRESACNCLAHSVRSCGGQAKDAGAPRRAGGLAPRDEGCAVPLRTRLTCSRPCVGIPPRRAPLTSQAPPLKRPASR